LRLAAIVNQSHAKAKLDDKASEQKRLDNPIAVNHAHGVHRGDMGGGAEGHKQMIDQVCRQK